MGIQRIDSLEFDPVAHSYRDQTFNKALTSVSAVIERIKCEFDLNRMAYLVARKEQVPVEVILEKWSSVRDRSAAYGTQIHEIMENASLYNQEYDYAEALEKLRMLRGLEFTATISDLRRAVLELQNMIYQYHTVLPELRIYNKEYAICGTMDLACQRNRTKNPTVDIMDFKTNIEKGIEFDSIRRFGSEWTKQYDRRMNFPVEHLEDCNYSHYSLQISMYAYMLECWFNVVIGRLSILYIDGDLVWHQIPVIYMRSEVIDVFKFVSANPGVIELPSPAIIDVPVKKNIVYNDDDDF